MPWRGHDDQSHQPLDLVASEGAPCAALTLGPRAAALGDKSSEMRGTGLIGTQCDEQSVRSGAGCRCEGIAPGHRGWNGGGRSGADVPPWGARRTWRTHPHTRTRIPATTPAGTGATLTAALLTGAPTDAPTAVPLGLAFLLGRRAASRSCTYGFGRAEDLAGVAVVGAVAVSVVPTGVTAVDRLLHPQLVGISGRSRVPPGRMCGQRVGGAVSYRHGPPDRFDAADIPEAAAEASA